jgi:hypothetical protein
MLAQNTDESFRAPHVRFGNAGGAVVQVLMRSDFFATEAFFCDHGRHLCVPKTSSILIAGPNRLNVNGDGRAALLLPDPVRLAITPAVQVPGATPRTAMGAHSPAGPLATGVDDLWPEPLRKLRGRNFPIVGGKAKPATSL